MFELLFWKDNCICLLEFDSMSTITSPAAKPFISKKIDNFFTDVHDLFKFIVQFFKEAFTPPYEFHEIIKQCYLVGYKSLALVTATAFITGMVFTDHSR